MLNLINLLLGLCLGSFYNVCISRIPKDESIISTRSHCPKCKKTIRTYDLIPIISYLILRGKCRSCGASIPLRYPIVEALTAVMLLLVVNLYGFSPEAAVNLIFFSILIIISFIDIENLLIPDVIVLIGIASALAYYSFAVGCPLFPIIGSASGFVIMYLLGITGKILLKKEALGEGDIKLAIMLGAFLGIKQLIVSIFFASITGLVITLFMLLLNKIKREDYLPFGAFLSAGAVIAFFFGSEILKFIGF